MHLPNLEYDWTRIYGNVLEGMFRTDEPNDMHLPDLEYDWTRIYGNVLEEIPKMPLNLLENLQQQLHSLMPTFCMTSSLEDLLLLSFTSLT